MELSKIITGVLRGAVRSPELGTAYIHSTINKQNEEEAIPLRDCPQCFKDYFSPFVWIAGVFTFAAHDSLVQFDLSVQKLRAPQQFLQLGIDDRFLFLQDFVAFRYRLISDQAKIDVGFDRINRHAAIAQVFHTDQPGHGTVIE